MGAEGKKNIPFLIKKSIKVVENVMVIVKCTLWVEKRQESRSWRLILISNNQFLILNVEVAYRAVRFPPSGGGREGFESNPISTNL